MFFGCFLILVLVGYWTLTQKHRWILLLVASYLFYISWNPAYLTVLIGTTLFNYSCSRWFLNSPNDSRNFYGMLLIIFVNLGALFSFKYLNLFTFESLSPPSWTGMEFSQESGFPIGLSFYTFQSLSYCFDLYRRKVPVEKHLGKFALFVAFFPQLLAGPIERAGKLLPQLNAKTMAFDLSVFGSGVGLFLWGLFKKVVVADNIANYLAPILNSETELSPENWLIAIYLYPFQLYGDFSGYSDMAVGMGRMMGIQLSPNFNRPYFAVSIHDFWRRWHISLTRWFSDYLFTPLALLWRNYGKIGIFLSILITFALSGVWHEASLNFLCWGLLNGCYLIFEQWIKLKWPENTFLRPLRILWIFHLVAFSFLFLITRDFEQSISVMKELPNVDLNAFGDILSLLKSSNLAIGVFLLLLVEIFLYERKAQLFRQQKIWLKGLVYSFLILCIVLFGNDAGSPFIYLRF